MAERERRYDNDEFVAGWQFFWQYNCLYLYENVKNCWTQRFNYVIIILKNSKEVIIMARMIQIAARVSEEEKAELEKYCQEHDIKIS